MAVILENERQYKFTLAQLAKLEVAYQEARSYLHEQDGAADVIKNAQLNSLAFLMDDLRAQIGVYERSNGILLPTSQTSDI